MASTNVIDLYEDNCCFEITLIDHTMQELQHMLFIELCIWLLGAFSDLLAFRSVKIVKIELFLRGLFFPLINQKLDLF